MAESVGMQACRQRVDGSVTAMVNELDREAFREMQRDMYMKSSKCCENVNASMSEVQSCIEKASHPLQAAQTYMQSELNDFLDRLQRCGMQCQDAIKDRLHPSATPTQVDSLKSELEDCVIKCGEKHINLIPSIKTRIKMNLANYR